MGAEYSPGLGLFLGTWEGQVVLSAGYNEAWHTEESVRDFLERVRVIVFEALEGVMDGR